MWSAFPQFQNACREKTSMSTGHGTSKQKDRVAQLECRSHVMPQWQRHQSEINLRIETRTQPSSKTEWADKNKKGLVVPHTTQPTIGQWNANRSKDSDENKIWNRMRRKSKSNFNLPLFLIFFSSWPRLSFQFCHFVRWFFAALSI